MRVVVVGATGNVGTSLLRALSREDQVDSVLGVARRKPELVLAKVEWAEADIASSELEPLFGGADAVVHLSWLIQPSRDLDTIRLALTAAETGHLVFGTLHTSSAVKTIDRIVDVFSATEKELVRTMLSQGRSARYLVPEPVWEYIITRELYAAGNGT